MSQARWMLNYKERRRRIKKSLELAWENSLQAVEDPGIRYAYPSLPRCPIRLIACQLHIDVNQGGLARLAEAFRLEEVSFSPEADHAYDFTGQRGAAAIQPFRWIDAAEAVAEANRAGYRTVAVTLTDRAVALESYRWLFPTAIVMGNEHHGVPAEVEAACHDTIAIPMYGMTTSLNVSAASAIVVHAAVSAYRATHPEFEPARRASRSLMGLPPADFTPYMPDDHFEDD